MLLLVWPVAATAKAKAAAKAAEALAGWTLAAASTEPAIRFGAQGIGPTCQNEPRVFGYGAGL